jgi:hypothetical protein
MFDDDEEDDTYPEMDIESVTSRVKEAMLSEIDNRLSESEARIVGVINESLKTFESLIIEKVRSVVDITPKPQAQPAAALGPKQRDSEATTPVEGGSHTGDETVQLVKRPRKRRRR